MASEAFAGVGTKFQRWNGASWDDIAEVNSIDGPGMTKDVLEVTSLETDAGYNEFITGFAEGGTLTLDMNFTRETYELMKEDFESDDVRSYRIVLPDYDSEPSTFTIEGLVIELPITMTADDKVTADVVIQITSEVILDVGSAVPAEESEIPAESEEPIPEPSGDSVYEKLLAVINDDGLTEVLYVFDEDITVEDTNKVISWADLISSSGQDLLEVGSDGTRPTKTATGVLFDGQDDVLQTVAAMSTPVNTPWTFYAIAKAVSFASNDRLGTFGTVESGLRQIGLNRVSMAGGATLSSNFDSTFLGQYNIFIGCFNGVNSWMHWNKDPEITGDAGTRPFNRVTLGATAALLSNANVEWAALMIRRGDDSTKEEAFFHVLNDAYVHYPLSAVCEDGDPLRVHVTWHESLDPLSLDMLPGDFSVPGHAVIDIEIDSSDDKGINLLLNSNVTAGEEIVVSYNSSSAGGLLTAGGDIVPNFRIPLINNIT